MRTMRYSTAKKMVEGQQALIDYLQTWLAIYEEKFKEANAMMQSDFNNSDCAGLVNMVHGFNTYSLQVVLSKASTASLRIPASSSC